MSRLHLLTGIGCYVTPPLWLLFLGTGILISLQGQFIHPEYDALGATLFPQWSAQDSVRAIWVFAGTMAMLLAPKLLGYLAILLRRPPGQSGVFPAVRGFLSVLIEAVLAALLAPIMMLSQTKALVEILAGRNYGWGPQRRAGRAPTGLDLLRRYTFHTVVGVAVGAAALAVSEALVFWMLPVIVGLMLAIPIVWLTSHPVIGRKLRSAGLLLTPEESLTPPILSQASDWIARDSERSHGSPGTGRAVARAPAAALKYVACPPHLSVAAKFRVGDRAQ
jgi:membrane glycosyltransferase